MAIWFQPYKLDEINKRGEKTLVEHLGIHITELGDDFIVATMPVDARTKQPAGLLHGGASAALSETLASTAANLVVDPQKLMCVGLEINANHLRSVTDGEVVGKCRPLHVGSRTHVWQTDIYQNEKLVCTSRLTLAVIQRR